MYVAVPTAPRVFIKVSVILREDAVVLAVPPVNAGSDGTRTGASQVKVTPAAGLVKLSRSIS